MARQLSLKPILGILLLGFLVFSHVQINKKYQSPLPLLKDLIFVNDSSALQDLSVIVSGFRSVAADLAWVELLQYMGGAEILDITDSAKDFPLLKSLTMRVVRIDPYFQRAYVFGAAILAWVRIVNRPKEAIDVLEEGIRYNPTYWPLHSYALSIGYGRAEETEKMLASLGDSVNRTDCPILVKAILANTFKFNKKYPEAIAIWQGVLTTSDDPGYRHRAQQQIIQIKKLMASKIHSTQNK